MSAKGALQGALAKTSFACTILRRPRIHQCDDGNDCNLWSMYDPNDKPTRLTTAPANVATRRAPWLEISTPSLNASGGGDNGYVMQAAVEQRSTRRRNSGRFWRSELSNTLVQSRRAQRRRRRLLLLLLDPRSACRQVTLVHIQCSGLPQPACLKCPVDGEMPTMSPQTTTLQRPNAYPRTYALLHRLLASIAIIPAAVLPSVPAVPSVWPTATTTSLFARLHYTVDARLF
ncbi:hypothetical protein THASP1DRAFT_23101 [Thamnocephalis sphaerospora]|uniref:Uncharacterized protein n=1 Tax=Thamnocephalis sphaerospora TaxID=78915 RepID=A0A4P9XU97_9FUNG|nr:hypothetical protein THASP1DRAFT_23101 [Thamnocephalis sphaerospora]|eukprot:RKP09010.1 hypothetical protein THASP1DRAFT_23101 [Thamnocephalis sphaerospora]